MNQAARKRLFAEEHVSYSAIGKYLRCPRSYRFRYLDRAPPETRASALVFGSALHEALATFYTAHKEKKPEPGHEELVKVFTEYFKVELAKPVPVLFSEKESPEGLLEIGAGMLRAFLEKAERPYRVVAVEEPFGIEIIDWETGEVLPKLVGFFDAVVQDEDGRYRILEHKSAAKRWTEDRLRHDQQVTAYGHVAPLVGYGHAAVTIQVLLKTKKPDFETYTPERTDEDRRDFLETVCGVLRSVDAKAFFPRRDWHCRSCEFASKCATAK